jgi:hypothetical protein
MPFHDISKFLQRSELVVASKYVKLVPLPTMSGRGNDSKTYHDSPELPEFRGIVYDDERGIFFWADTSSGHGFPISDSDFGDSDANLTFKLQCAKVGSTTSIVHVALQIEYGSESNIECHLGSEHPERPTGVSSTTLAGCNQGRSGSDEIDVEEDFLDWEIGMTPLGGVEDRLGHYAAQYWAKRADAVG